MITDNIQNDIDINGTNSSNESNNTNRPLGRISREEINNAIREVDERNMRLFIRRGFNIFLLHGISQIELRNLRLLFHLSAYQQSLLRHENLDWTSEGMFEREERWLMSQLMDNYVIRRNRNRTHRGMRIVVRGRYNNFESNFAILQGLAIGFALNVFTFVLLMVYRARPKLKMGLFCGMLLSIIFVNIPFLFRR